MYTCKMEVEPSADANKDEAVLDVPKKQCTNCLEEKSLEDGFHIHRQMKDGRSSWCKVCQNAHLKKGQLPKKKGDGSTTSENDVLESNDPEVTDSLYVFTMPLNPNIVKIGRSMNPQKRAKELARSMPYEIMVCYVYPKWGFMEKAVHEKLKDFRVLGGSGVEWFSLEPHQADVVIKYTALEHELNMKSTELAAVR